MKQRLPNLPTFYTFTSKFIRKNFVMFKSKNDTRFLKLRIEIG